jgi:hypothetical protein
MRTKGLRINIWVEERQPLNEVLGQVEMAMLKAATQQQGKPQREWPVLSRRPLADMDQGAPFLFSTTGKKTEEIDTWALLLPSAYALRWVRCRPELGQTAQPDSTPHAWSCGEAETQSRPSARWRSRLPTESSRPLVVDWSRGPRNGPLAVKHAGQLPAGWAVR